MVDPFEQLDAIIIDSVRRLVNFRIAAGDWGNPFKGLQFKIPATLQEYIADLYQKYLEEEREQKRRQDGRDGVSRIPA